MAMPNRQRIVTFMYQDLLGNSTPQEILAGGNRVVTLPDPYRVFVIRTVFYDESMTPLYASPSYMEKKYLSLADLRSATSKGHPALDAPILDRDNHFKTYDDGNI